MFRKILIAEDYQSVNLSVQKTLEEIGIVNPEYVYYCDDALMRIQTALQKNHSYDLLITDLHFETDHNNQKINNGEALIIAARKIQHDLKILVFSATGKPATIEALFSQQDIDGYVFKGRQDAVELKEAINKLSNHQRYFPKQYRQQIRQQNTHDFTPFDVTIISQLACGKRQKDIPLYLQKKGIQPSGLSSIEKRLNLIKEAYNFSTNEQLIAYCKDFGII